MTTTPVKTVILRTGAVLASTGVMLGMLTACTPEPEPTPTKTALFASEEEAFAAAEETYREFTNRLNEVDTSDPRTFEPLFDLSTGEFEEADRKTYSTLHAENYSITGDTVVARFNGVESENSHQTVIAAVCLDVSRVEVTDASGVSKVDPNRPDVYAIEVTFVAERGQLLIAKATQTEDQECGG